MTGRLYERRVTQVEELPDAAIAFVFAVGRYPAAVVVRIGIAAYPQHAPVIQRDTGALVERDRAMIAAEELYHLVVAVGHVGQQAIAPPLAAVVYIGRQ